jgi:enterochelin esterase-like enzyme
MELIPWLRERYNVTRDPQLTVVGGESAGGTGAVYAALRAQDRGQRNLRQKGQEEEQTGSRSLLKNRSF